MQRSLLKLGIRGFRPLAITFTVALTISAAYSVLSPLGIVEASPKEVKRGNWFSDQGVDLEWHQIVDKAETLLSTTKDRTVLLSKLEQDAAHNGLEQELILLNVLIRLGHSDDAKNAVRNFVDVDRGTTVATGAMRSGLLTAAADFLIDKKEYSVASEFIDKFPESRPFGAQQLVQQLATNQGDTKTDQWLLSLANAMPNDSYWIEQRIRWKSDNHAAKPLFDQMRAQLKIDPSNFAEAKSYIYLANAVEKDRPNLDELADVLKPKFAYQCYLLALELQPRTPKSAAALYERSLALPFTSEDQKEWSAYVLSHWSFSRAPRTTNEWEEWLRHPSKTGLVESYTASGQIAKAQKLINELSENEPNGLPGLSLSGLAGKIQGASEKHPLEDKIRAAELENKESFDYWVSRANYYYGRKDKPNMVAAYEKAFTLCPIDTEAGEYNRSNLLNNFRREWSLLGGSNDEISQLLEREYKVAVPGTYYMRSVLSEIVNSDKSERLDNLLRNDSKVWEHLKSQKEWLDCSLIVKVAKLAGPNNVADVWNRASALTLNADTSKAYQLAEAMRRCERPDLASKMYQQTIEEASKAIAAALRSGDTSAQKNANENYLRMSQSDLFSCYIALNDWKSAENNWKERAALEPGISNLSCLADLALAAARVGAKEQSMRFWSEHSALDRTSLGPLHELVDAGMRKELTEFYRKLNKDDPKSTAPAAALKLLSQAES